MSFDKLQSMLDNIKKEDMMENSVNKWFGSRIKYLRNLQNLTAKELAEKAGIKASHLCKIEKGETSIQLNTLDKISKALDKRIDFVDNGIDEVLRKKYTDMSSKQFKMMMSKLEKEPDFRRDDTFGNQYAQYHIMYKLDSYETEDNDINCHLTYEFLIEYKITEPSVGIYYGAKVIIQDHECSSSYRNTEITTYLLEQWKNKLASKIVTILNNTFPNSDFSQRIKLTNNANDNTFWPFWISLNSDEDVIQVAARALRIIQRIYTTELKLDPCSKIEDNKVNNAVTNFTEDSYKAIIRLLSDISRKGEQSNLIKFYESFIKGLCDQKIIKRDPRYEKAWIIAEETWGSSQFRQLIVLFFDKAKELNFINKEPQDTTPRNYWVCFNRIILNKDNTVMANLAKQQEYANYNLREKDVEELFKVITEH